MIVYWEPIPNLNDSVMNESLSSYEDYGPWSVGIAAMRLSS